MKRFENLSNLTMIIIRRSINAKKTLIFIFEKFIAYASTINSSTLVMLNPSAGIMISSSTALLIPVAILITNEYISKTKIRYTKLPHWISVITFPYEKTLKESMVDENIDQKEAEEIKKVYKKYLDGTKELIKNTQFRVEINCLKI